MNVGHGHPKVVAAIKAQADQLLHTCFHVATYEPYVELCERLAALRPHGDSTKVLLLNSGAEAVENTVKIRTTGHRSSGGTLLYRGVSWSHPARDVPDVQGRLQGRVRPWLRALRALCDEHGIVLIIDEVQSGFCRTGHWGVYQHYGVTPDISTWAKSLGGGLPISAVVGKAVVMDAAAPGTLGGTYGGNPVACATALAAIDAMEELDLNRRAKAVGERVRARFVALQARCPAIGDVRGIGAMIGVEFVEEGDPARPAGAFVKEVLAAALQHGVLSIAAGTHGNVIRILSPLVISDEDLEHGLNILEEEVLAAWSRHEAAPARTRV